MKTELYETIENRFIRPLDRPATDLAGVEIELPIVNLSGNPVDFDVCHQMMDAFLKSFPCSESQTDEDGFIYNAALKENGDIISFDCSYNTLEFSFAPENDLHLPAERFVSYYTFCQDFLKPHNYTLTGMGINPHYNVNQNIPIKNSRYRMLFHHLSSFKKYGSQIPFHQYPNFGLFSTASQVQLDVDHTSFLTALNAFTKLEPLKAVLTANSMFPEQTDKLLCRDDLWEYSLHGLNRHNIGMLETEIHSEEEMIQYIGSMSLYCVTKGDKYINFRPTPLSEYFQSDTLTGEYYDQKLGGYRTIEFQPELSDLNDLRSFKFEDLTFRGTIEFRSSCTQPVSEAFSSAALHAGLMKKVSELDQLLSEDTCIYHKGYNASELRKMFQLRGFPSFVDQKELKKLLISVLNLAVSGLQERGYGEEHFLDPLFRRAETLISPAREIADELEQGKSLEEFIHQFATL